MSRRSNATRLARSNADFGVLVVSRHRARLLLFDMTTVVEVVDTRFPVRADGLRARNRGHDPDARMSYARHIEDALERVVVDDPELPLVLAGEPSAVTALLQLPKSARRFISVLPGDHDHTTPTALRGLVLRRLRALPPATTPARRLSGSSRRPW